MPATDGTWRVLEVHDAAGRRAIAYGIIASTVLLLALGMFLLIRRASGAFTSPLPPLLLLTTALVLLACVWGVRVCWLRFFDPESILSPKLDRWLFLWLPSAVIVLFAVACSYPGNRIVDWLVWAPAIAAASAPWKVRSQARSGSTATSATQRELVTGKQLQQLTRTRTIDGREMIEGSLLAEFAPGERSVDLFVGFCPPFERLPDVEAESAADTTDASVKLVQVLHNGAQLEVRLVQPAVAPTAVSIQFFAAEPTQNGSAI
jgi:hypothetical protein